MSSGGQPMPSPVPPAPTGVSAMLSGDNTIGHVTGVTVIGNALADVATWALSLAHITVPDNVELAFGVLFAVAASWLAQKMA